jgi:hypothetical protein
MSARAYPRLGRGAIVIVAAMAAALLSSQYGCVATKYKLAKKGSAPVQPLNIAFPPSPPLQSTLASLISYGGPGSWKREALWDEYVVVLENHGERPITIQSAALRDSAATPYAPGNDPWALEKRSKQLEQQYRKRGQAFLRAAGPGVVIVAGGAAAVSLAAGSATAGGFIGVAPATAGAVVAAAYVLPVYYVAVVGINHRNKRAVMAEFKRRQLPLPLTLAPGESRAGSLFYPMVRSPDSLTIAWSSEAGSATAVLPLEFLHSLHVPAPPADHASKEVP